MKALVENGIEPYFRLGVTIENQFMVRAYRIHPPKDFAKWARICEHVVRHYTEGWANGFKMKISHWEIWNEPDSELGRCPMWTGTFKEFCRLYDIASKHLKAKFPHLMIGGYGSSGFFKVVQEKPRPHDDFTMAKFEEFVAYVKAHGCPLDFFSFHAYDMPGAPLTPKTMRAYVDYARRTLDAAGLKDCELSMNEWLPRWSKPGSIRQAALVGGILASLQESPVDDAEIYDAHIGMGLYSPFFNPDTQALRKAYWPFKAFSELRKLGSSVKSSSSSDDVAVTAAVDGRGRGAVLVANVGGDVAWKLNLGDWRPVTCIVIDETHDYAAAELPQILPADSVWLVFAEH